MANQSPDRRRVLELIATAAAASQFPGFSRWAFAEPQHAHQHGSETSVPSRPEHYTPQFFSSSEYRTIELLTELIIPTDESPGAKDAGVSEFIDFMAAHGDQGLQGPMRNGLLWLDRAAKRSDGPSFVSLQPSQQEALLTSIAYPSHLAASDGEGHAFFKLIRRYTVMGYYTSRVGLKELDYPGLAFYSESPECPHKDDPEHRHLPPARL